MALEKLSIWASALSNHAFAAAYAAWCADMASELDKRRTALDHEDIAKAILTGLPRPPVP